MDCDGGTELAYGEFSKHLRERVAGKRIPLSGSLELTFRCNLRCVHCYLDGQHTPSPDQHELTTSEITDIIDQIVAEGCLWLLLTGGEPLVRSDWKEIYLYAKHKGLIVTLFTNGTLLTPEDADFLAEWRPFVVEISLYGATQETYERVTGVPGSYEKCLRGIQLLVDRGVPLRLKTPLMTINKDELAALQQFAEGQGAEFRYDPILKPELDGAQGPLKYRLSPAEVVDVEVEDPVRSSRWPERFELLHGRRDIGPELFVCGAGKQSFHIDAYGMLSLCIVARTPSYSLRLGRFHEAWSGFLADVRRAQHSREHQCTQCDLRSLCAQCPAVAVLETGDPEQPVSYLCEVTHLRAEAFMTKSHALRGKPYLTEVHTGL